MPPTEVGEIPAAFFDTHPQFESKTFNAVQTWIEYLNRLVGATIGLLMFLTAAFSLVFWKKDIRIVILSVLAMVMTGVEGWLGKLVVDRNLAGGMVTAHLLLAVLIMAVLILANYLVAARHLQVGERPQAGSRTLVWVGAAVLLLTLVQVLVGTQVRETVDEMAAALGPSQRGEWLQPSVFYTLHKATWMLMSVVLALWLRQVMRQLAGNRMVRTLSIAIVAFVVLEVLLGMVLAYKALPPAVQPVHMLLANLILAAEFSIWIHVVGVQRWLARADKTASETLRDGALMNAER